MHTSNSHVRCYQADSSSDGEYAGYSASIVGNKGIEWRVARLEPLVSHQCSMLCLLQAPRRGARRQAVCSDGRQPGTARAVHPGAMARHMIERVSHGAAYAHPGRCRYRYDGTFDLKGATANRQRVRGAAQQALVSGERSAGSFKTLLDKA